MGAGGDGNWGKRAGRLLDGMSSLYSLSLGISATPACVCARVHAFAHLWVSALGRHECYSAGVYKPWHWCEGWRTTLGIWFSPSIMWVPKLVSSTITCCATLEAQRQNLLLNLEFTHWLRWLTDELETCLSPPHPSAGATDYHCAPSLYTGAGDPQSGPRFTNWAISPVPEGKKF